VILELMEMIIISLRQQNIALYGVSIIINNKSQNIRKYKNSAMQVLQLHLNYIKTRQEMDAIFIDNVSKYETHVKHHISADNNNF
jgi:hypothetical protein